MLVKPTIATPIIKIDILVNVIYNFLNTNLVDILNISIVFEFILYKIG